jgi:tetratricopeptide (TPR) repeat protein
MSAKTVFISYRRDATGKAFARSLKQELTRHGYDVFFDVDSIDAGKWANQILTEVPVRSHFLLLLTPGALDRCVNEDDWVRQEFEAAVKSERNIVPIREESVDLAKLREECPEYMKGLFDFQIATVRQDGFESDIVDLLERYIPPHKAPSTARTSTASFHADISRIVKYAPAELIGREDETEILNDAWDQVVRGEKKRPHILTFVALGGEGKTSLVAKWAANLAADDWPGCDAVFAWSFYSQGTREQLAASADLFLKEALIFFGDDADKQFAASPAGAFEKGQRLARIVASRRSLLILDGLEPLQYPTEAKAFKPGELKDQGIAKLLKDLATTNLGLCIVTTRIEMPDLNAFKGGAVIETHLKRLPRAAGVNLLKSLGVKGSERRDKTLKDSDPNGEKVNEFEKLVEDVKGHALTLTLLGGFLSRAFHGDIRQRDRVKFEKADEKIDGGHAFRTMAAYEQWLLRDGGDEGQREVAVLRLLGLFDRPADGGCLAALLQPPAIQGLTEPLVGLAEEDWQFCLTGLESAKLLTVSRDDSANPHSAITNPQSLDAHPHLREYFAKQLREKNPDAWRTAHRRIYEHLCAITPDKPQPTLEDLQPLYQAVAHGCQAGLHHEALHNVYGARLLRGTGNGGFYSARKLGLFGSDLGGIACFFELPWNRVSSLLKEDEQAWMLNEAARALSALGRLTEALEPIRAGLKTRLNQEVWKSASVIASNLSELELTLGEVAGAVGDSEQAVAYADRSGDAFQRMHRRVRAADALHQAGRRAKAETLFREAEQMQAESDRAYPLLYSLSGFQYCDLLLAAPERDAWRMTLELKTPNLEREMSIESSRQVSRRMAKLFEWRVASDGLLAIALEHLTQGRASLYEVVLAVDDLPFKTQNSELKTSIDTAVDDLRRAGQQQYLPLGLLTRAWLRFLTGARTGPESAQEDLDEAWEIAERGPMKLFMADIHLYRARLFGGMKDEGGGMKYPWDKNPDGTARGPKDDLAAARKLIEQCGYWRRKEELEDAEEAAKGW